MRTFIIVFAAILVAASTAQAQVMVRYGGSQAPINPTVRCRGLNMPCALQPPPVQMNVGTIRNGQAYIPPQRNVLMPFTRQNVYGRQVLIMPRRYGGYGGYGGGYDSTFNGDDVNGNGVVPMYGNGPVYGGGGYANGNGGDRDRGEKKARFLAGCEAYGAQVQQQGGGRLNCHVDAHVETYIDGERVE